MRRTTLPQVAAAAALLGAVAAPVVAAPAVVADREYGPGPDDREYSVVADREY